MLRTVGYTEDSYFHLALCLTVGSRFILEGPLSDRNGCSDGCRSLRPNLYMFVSVLVVHFTDLSPKFRVSIYYTRLGLRVLKYLFFKDSGICGNT